MRLYEEDALKILPKTQKILQEFQRLESGSKRAWNVFEIALEMLTSLETAIGSGL